MLKKSNIKYIIYIAVILIFFVPLLRLVILSFKTETAYGIQNYVHIMNEEKTYKAIFNTIFIALFSTIFSVFIGTFFAWLIAYTDIKYKKFIEFLIILPFVIPAYITTLSWIQFMASNGFIVKFFSIISISSIKPMNMYSLKGIILILGICNSSLVYLFTVNTFRKIPRELEFAARICGSSYIKSFIKINIPMALPGIIGGGILSFLAAVDNFVVPAMLGTSSGISVLSTYIYENVIGFGPSFFSRSAVLSVILGFIALIGVFMQTFIMKKSKNGETIKEDFRERVKLGRYRLAINIIILSVLLIINIVPIMSMFSTSLIKAYGLELNINNITLNNYIFVLSDLKTKNALINSFVLALTCTALCIFIGTSIAYMKIRKNTLGIKFIEMNMNLTYALPGTVLALALIIYWIQPLPGIKPNVYGTIKILMIAYISRYLILQIRGSYTALSQIDLSIEEASRICGSNTFVKWKKILIPIIAADVLSGSFLVFMASLTEVTLSSLLSSVGTETIGVTVLNYQQGGYLSYATAFSSIIVLIISLVYFLLSIFPKLILKGDRV